jgi:hypothetical protein
LLGVLNAGLVVGDDSGGNGRERKSFGGRISISGGLGQLAGGGSVVQADKATVDSACQVPDDWLLQNRRALLLGREVLKAVMAAFKPGSQAT